MDIELNREICVGECGVSIGIAFTSPTYITLHSHSAFSRRNRLFDGVGVRQQTDVGLASRRKRTVERRLAKSMAGSEQDTSGTHT